MNRIPKLRAVIVLLLLTVMVCGWAWKSTTRDVILATTTSVQDTGLLDYLKPIFKKKTGYNLKAIAVGSGAAIAMARKGEADVLLAHSPADEELFMNDGYGLKRTVIMQNDFVVLGPETDPAEIKGLTDVVLAFKKIYDLKSKFVSRGDQSGTHKKELSLWKEAGVTLNAAAPPAWDNYIEAGLGMAKALAVANEKQAYVLCDRSSYLFQRKNLDLRVKVAGDKRLLNWYSVIELNPTKFAKINSKGGKAFYDFMTSPATQKLISEFGLEYDGTPLFKPMLLSAVPAPAP